MDFLSPPHPVVVVFCRLPSFSGACVVRLPFFFLRSLRFQLWRPIAVLLSATLLGMPEYSAAVGSEASCPGSDVPVLPSRLFGSSRFGLDGVFSVGRAVHADFLVGAWAMPPS